MTVRSIEHRLKDQSVAITDVQMRLAPQTCCLCVVKGKLSGCVGVAFQQDEPAHRFTICITWLQGQICHRDHFISWHRKPFNGYSDRVSNHFCCIRWHFKHLQNCRLEKLTVNTVITHHWQLFCYEKQFRRLMMTEAVASLWWSVAPERNLSDVAADDRWLRCSECETRLLFVTDQRSQM